MPEKDPPSEKPTEKTNKPWQFQPGQSGNPNGRPKGSRGRSTAILDAMAEGASEKIMQMVLDAAEAGDLDAARIVLTRIWTPRKGRPIAFALPPIRSAADTLVAVNAVLETVANGTLSVEEGKDVTDMIDVYRSAFATLELEERIKNLEELQQASSGKP